MKNSTVLYSTRSIYFVCNIACDLSLVFLVHCKVHCTAVNKSFYVTVNEVVETSVCPNK